MPSSTETQVQPHLSNELFGLFIESLGDDLSSLRACSLVSSVFRHFCRPILYRDIVLDRREKLDSFLQFGDRSDSLIHAKSLSLTYFGFETKAHLRKPRKILEIISRKTSLETLRLHRVQFHAETFTAQLLSKLGSVAALALRECRFGGFEDFVTFIRCFPRCQVLRLHRCTWIREFPKFRLRNVLTYDLAPAHLEITSTSTTEWGEGFCDQGRIVGMSWLNLAGLKSFTYVIEEDTVSGPVFDQIAACEFLEEMDLSVNYPGGHDFAIAQLGLLIFRVKSLTLRCFTGLLPWWFSYSSNSLFPPSMTLEHIRIVTPGPFPMIEGCKVLDTTFSDPDRYPSLVELEVCLPGIVKVGKKTRDVHERLFMDEHLPRLKGFGRLSTRSTPSGVERIQSVGAFESVAGAYYRAST